MEIITSRTNPLCTHLRKLASSVSYRRRLRGVPLRQPQAAGGGFAVESGPADSGLHGPRRPACPARYCPPRPGAAGI